MMTISEALSKRGIQASLDALEFGKKQLGDAFYSSCVTRLTKNGFWADIKDKDGKVYKVIGRTNQEITSVYFR